MQYPMLPPALCAFLGAWFSIYHPVSVKDCIYLGAILALFAVLIPNLLRLRFVLVCSATFLMGTASAGSVSKGPILTGLFSLSGKILRNQDGLLILDLNRIDDQGASGKIGVIGASGAPGTTVHLWGRTKPLSNDDLPGAWSRELSAEAAGIRTLVQTKGYVLQPQPEPSPFAQSKHPALLDRLILGRKTTLPVETERILAETGTRHLLAISGLHVGMVSLWGAWVFGAMARFIALFWRRGHLRFLPALGACCTGLFYAQMAGMPVSAQRALVMVVFSWCCWSLYRPAKIWNLYALALAGTVFFNPGQVRSLSFCLSFSAVAGVIIATQWCAPKIKNQPRWLRWLASSLAASIGAQAGCLCVNAWVFQSMPIFAPFANLLAIPLVGLVILPGAFLSLAGIDQGLWIADAGLSVLFNWLPLMKGPILHPAVGPFGATGLLLALVCSKNRSFSLCLTILALGLKSQSSTGLRVTHFAVGQGDSSLIERNGTRVLVDGGPRKTAVLHTLRRQGIHHLDEVVLSHPHKDHMEGLQSILQNINIGCFRLPQTPDSHETEFKALVQYAEQKDIPLCWGTENPLPGFRLIQAENLALGINDRSLVVEVEYQGIRALITGDIEARGEALLAPDLQPVTWLKAPHHGSRGASSSALLTATQPQFAVFSSGKENRFGHPHKTTLARYKNSQIFQTAKDGSVVFHTAKQQRWTRKIASTQLWAPWKHVPP
jgi:competence protein ComEC